MGATFRTSRLARTIVSYIPSRSLMPLRQLGDLPERIRRTPHEADFWAFTGFGVEEPVVVDVGANRGQSIRSFSLSIPRATLHAFEPNAHLADYLRTSTDAHVYNVALGDASSTMRLFIPRYGNTEWDTRATADRTAADAFLSKEHFLGFRPDRASLIEFSVDVRTLDSYGLSPDIIKVDAEGAAAAVIRGARDTIRAHRPVVLVEDGGGEPEDLMAELGYRPARYDRGGGGLHIDEVGSPNTFFVTDSHSDILAPAFLNA